MTESRETYDIDLTDMLTEIYDRQGAFGVYEFAKIQRPDWPWNYCQECEAETPNWSGICAVCFTSFVEPPAPAIVAI